LKSKKIKIEGFKKQIKMDVIRDVKLMLDASIPTEKIAKALSISTQKVRAIDSSSFNLDNLKAQNGGAYTAQVKEGYESMPGTACPYGKSELGARCAWLAGHYDAHGYTAWDLARQPANAGNLEEDRC